MGEVLWEAPVLVLNSPRLMMKSGHECVVDVSQENEEDGSTLWTDLHFHGVQAFRYTYEFAVGSEMTKAAYGRLIDLGHTPWLQDVQESVSQRSRGMPWPSKPLRHLMVRFDDEGCYEFLCERFEAVPRSP